MFDVVVMVPMESCLSWHITRSRTSTGHSLSVQVVNKTRYVWRVYLEKEQFNLAIRHCGDQQAAMGPYPDLAIAGGRAAAQ